MAHPSSSPLPMPLPTPLSPGMYRFDKCGAKHLCYYLRRYNNRTIEPDMSYGLVQGASNTCGHEISVPLETHDMIIAGDIAAPVYCMDFLVASYCKAANRLAQRNTTRERNPVGPLHKTLVENGVAVKKVVFADDDIVLARRQFPLDESTPKEHSTEDEETKDVPARANALDAGPSLEPSHTLDGHVNCPEAAKPRKNEGLEQEEHALMQYVPFPSEKIKGKKPTKMAFIHTIADLPNFDELVDPETGTHALIKARCEDEIGVPKETAAEVINGTRPWPLMCALCCHEWERDNFFRWQELKTEYDNGDDVDYDDVRVAREEWQSAKVSLLNQMMLEDAWTDEEEETAFDYKMSPGWRAKRAGRAANPLRFNEQDDVREFDADEQLAGKKREGDDLEEESPSKRQRTA
ncbi:hypothetical protein BKA80DRAFT_256289 [Phyllosticta citrichinensis]